MSDSRPTINARDLVAVLRLLPAEKSVLIVGPHGIGKSHIAHQLGDHFGLPVVDRRLSQMTEGDMIGIPIVTGESTRFLPVDWFLGGCKEPKEILLDEVNRGGPEIMNAAFQIILDRELNGNKLHPESRVIACVNAGSHYSVNEMDPAMINRFAVFHLSPDVDDWMAWAAERGEIDPIIVDYIRHNPGELRFKDLDKMEPMTAYPTPRGWEAVDKCLKAANLAPSQVCGESTAPVFFQLCASLIGHPAAIGFSKFVSNYSKVISAQDILDRWETTKPRVKALGHDAVVALLAKIGEHCKNEDWTVEQVKNLEDFSTSLGGEDLILLFSEVAKTKKIPNVSKVHKTGITMRILEAVKSAEQLANKKK